MCVRERERERRVCERVNVCVRDSSISVISVTGV